MAKHYRVKPKKRKLDVLLDTTLFATSLITLYLVVKFFLLVF